MADKTFLTGDMVIWPKDGQKSGQQLAKFVSQSVKDCRDAYIIVKPEMRTSFETCVSLGEVEKVPMNDLFTIENADIAI